MNLKPVIREAAQKALGDACEFLLDEMNKIVPHDEGFFQNGRCGKWVEITINKYGDQAMKYLAQALKEAM